MKFIIYYIHVNGKHKKRHEIDFNTILIYSLKLILNFFQTLLLNKNDLNDLY